MSSKLVRMGAKLKAHQLGSAIQVARRAHYQPHDDIAHVLAVMTMPGESHGIWAVAWGRPGTQPQIKAVVSPARQKDQIEIWRWLANKLLVYVQQCRTAEMHCQIVVPSDASLNTLRAAADHWAEWDNSVPAEIRRTAKLILALSEFHKRPGSHIFMPMMSILNEHWVAGCDLNTLEEWISWLDGSPMEPQLTLDSNIYPNPRNVTQEQLYGLFAKAQQKRRGHDDNDDGPSMSMLGQQFANKYLQPAVKELWRRTERAWNAFCATKLQPLQEYERWCDADIREMNRVAEKLNNDKDPWYEEKPSDSAIELTRREALVDLFEADCVWSDEWMAALAVADGEAVIGEVLLTGSDSWEVVSTQDVISVRNGDRMFHPSAFGKAMIVQRMERDGRAYKLLFDGQPPTNDKKILLLPAPPNWGMATTLIQNTLNKVTKGRPWTHYADVPLEKRPGTVPMPADIVGQIEASRAQ